MKNTIKLIALLLITIIVITGCGMKEDIRVTISADENVSIEAIVAFDDEMIDSMISMGNEESGEKTYTDEERWAYLESSDNSTNTEHSSMYTETERYEDETFKGNKYKATNIKLTDLVKDNEEEIDFNGFVNENKLFTKNGNEYSIHLKSSQSESQEEEPVQVNSDIDTEDIDQVLDLKFAITLPAPAKSNNATEVSEDKLTYSWDLLKTPAVDLVFEIPENIVKDEPKEEEKKITIVQWSDASNWAEEELKTAQLTGIIPTTLEGKDFKVNITRKDFAAVSVKLYETITKTMSQVSINKPFTDTDDAFVLKAYDLGITTGTSATEFSPNAEITREQMATMLTRALAKAEIDTKVDLASARLFADDAEISSWAKDSVYFMSNNEIIKGIDDNNFGAKNNSTIEQAVIVALRSVEKLAK